MFPPKFIGLNLIPNVVVLGGRPLEGDEVMRVAYL